MGESAGELVDELAKIWRAKRPLAGLGYHVQGNTEAMRLGKGLRHELASELVGESVSELVDELAKNWRAEGPLAGLGYHIQ